MKNKQSLENEKIRTAAGQEQLTGGRSIDNYLKNIIQDAVKKEVERRNEE